MLQLKRMTEVTANDVPHDNVNESTTVTACAIGKVCGRRRNRAVFASDDAKHG